MRVLIVSAFPPDPAPEANHALHISEHLAERGHTVHVLCRCGSVAATHPRIVVHPVMGDWTWTSVPTLVKLLKAIRPDSILLLYIGWVYRYQAMITFLPSICKRVLPGVPCVTQFENIDEDPPREPFSSRLLRKAMALWSGRREVHPYFGTLVRDSARVIVLSSPHRDRLERHCSGAREKSVIVPPPPIIRLADPPDIVRAEVRAALDAGENEFVIAYWGHIYPGKGVEVLLRAFRAACARTPNLRLLMVGGSLEFPPGSIHCREYHEKVQRLPHTLGIEDKVTWTGHFAWDSDEGSRYLHAADLCVLPFDYGVTLNNSSLAAATTHGLPVIATELPAGGWDEGLEHGRNIYLCAPRDSEVLGEAISLLARDDALRTRLSEGSRRLAEKWHSWDSTSARLIDLLGSATPDAKSHPPQGNAPVSLPREVPIPNAVQSPPVLAAAHGSVRADSGRPGQDRKERGERSAHLEVPDVSVIVAAYNVEGYLRQCLDSLVNQTLKNIEIIAVNDASTDGSLTIIREYQSAYQNLRLVDCPHNVGLASVRNIGIQHARGRYIAFLDGDDWADVRMCELLYGRASEYDTDVLVADATVFYEDTKTFGRFFDWGLRRDMDGLKGLPCCVLDDPRILLLEPVAWTKLYKRTFLEEHAITFEDGMNSYEDVCFHFSVLVKASRLAVIDERVVFYRQNRPGQISGRTSRKVFEVFDVFEVIRANLYAWSAAPEIWAMFIKVQMRQYDWLIMDRVMPSHRREFCRAVAEDLRHLPETGKRSFARQATRSELVRLLCLRRNWPRLYAKVRSGRSPVGQILSLAYGGRRGAMTRALRGFVGGVRRRVYSALKWRVSRFLDLTRIRKMLSVVGEEQRRTTATQKISRSDRPVIEVCGVDDQVLLMARLPGAGLEDAIWRLTHDYYLIESAILREGDVVVDIGAHIGLLSIYLGKKYPFVTVYALEPNPANYECLRRNVELNGVTNVVPINAALSGSGKEMVLYSDPLDGSWASVDRRTAIKRPLLSEVEVDSLTLEQLFNKYGIGYCRLMKITAPGAVKDLLSAVRSEGCVDFLCGEVDFDDCNRVELEAMSWRLARHHFWRTVDGRSGQPVHAWLHSVPNGATSEVAHPPAPAETQLGRSQDTAAPLVSRQ